MSEQPADPKGRFSDRVDDYVRYRPGYPDALIEALRRRIGLSPQWVIADIGSGTGISSRLFVRLGCTVYGVEPNAAMRRAAEVRLSAHANFHSLDAQAEATTLLAAGVDLVCAGQAFHWFEAEPARLEFERILRPPRYAALFWNTRDTELDVLHRSYEDLLQRYAVDYRAVDHRRVSGEAFDRFFLGGHQSYSFPNAQTLDWEGLQGRLFSCSYMPAVDQPGAEPMLKDLRSLFQQHQRNGRVRIAYRTELHVGLIAPAADTRIRRGKHVNPCSRA